MTFSSNWREISIFSFLFILYQYLSTSAVEIREDYIHHTLAEFLRRGQLVIESKYAPLTFFLEIHCTIWQLQTLHNLARTVIFVTPMILFSYRWKPLSQPGGRIRIAFSGISSYVLFQILYADVLVNAVSIGSEISDLLLIWTTTMNICAKQKSSMAIPTSFYLTLALMFETTCLKIAVVMCLLIWGIFFQCLNHLKTHNTSFMIFCVKPAYKTLIHFLISAALVMVIFSNIYPAAETKAGGNYNLRYLSPIQRRNARKGYIGPKVSQLPEYSRDWPRYALAPTAPLTIYMPGAGFLGTDAYWWSEESSFDPTIFNEPGSKRDGHFEHRSFFSDLIKEVEPWEIELPLLKSSGHTSPRAYNYIKPQRNVRIRSVSSRGYLGVSHTGESSTKGTDSDEEFERWEVSVTSNSSFRNTLWNINYDPDKDIGFRLYNAESRCLLSTSYRIFPSWSRPRTNDTILKELRLEIEVMCTRGVNAQASTFYAIDGFDTRSSETSSRTLIPRFIVDSWQHTLHIMAAMYSQYKFRGRWAVLQDISSELTQPQKRQHDYTTSMLIEFICLSFMVAYTMRIFWVKRIEGSLGIGMAMNDASQIRLHCRRAYHFCAIITTMALVSNTFFGNVLEVEPGISVVVSIFGGHLLFEDILF